MSEKLTMPVVAATGVMGTVGFGWGDLTEQVEHVINVLEKEGDAAIRVARGMLTMIGYFASKDFTKAFVLMTAVSADVKGIVAAIREEWGQ